MVTTQAQDSQLGCLLPDEYLKKKKNTKLQPKYVSHFRTTLVFPC